MKLLDFDNCEQIGQGAEAKIYLKKYQGKKCVFKHRFAKKYRHPSLDVKLRKKRTRAEFKRLKACKKEGIRAPETLYMNDKEGLIIMEHIDCKPLKCTLRDEYNEETKLYSELCVNACRKMGVVIAKLHTKDFIHGDLTTSNFLYEKTENKLIPIDFGLAQRTNKAEDKAVDLYVLERAFVSTHKNSEPLVEEIMKAYTSFDEEKANIVLDRLKAVQARGRKRSMIG